MQYWKKCLGRGHSLLPRPLPRWPHPTPSAPAALDLSAFGVSWPPKWNFWIRPCCTVVPFCRAYGKIEAICLKRRVTKTADVNIAHWSNKHAQLTQLLNRSNLLQHVNRKQCQLETKASSHEGQCIPAGCRVTLPRRTLITMSITTMRSRLFPANSASDCLDFLKFRPQFSSLVAPSADGSANCLLLYKVHLVL